MAESTGIEWCDSTFNPWIGCSRVSPACDHCYAAESTPARTLDITWGAGQARRRTAPSNWALPLRWNTAEFAQCPSCGWRGEARKCVSVPHPDDQMPTRGCPVCRAAGVRDARRRVFCASLADVFDNEEPDEWRMQLFRLMADTANLQWMVLTKRIGNVRDYTRRDGLAFDLIGDGRVWLGATICNQAEADRDIPKLLATPARVRFLSMEPLLGPVNLRLMHNAPLWAGDGPGALCRASDRLGLHWVIVGGESGQRARPMHPDWARSLRDQCAAAGVPFLFKQWGEWAPLTFDDGLTGGEVGRDAVVLHPPGARPADMHRPGKKTAGRALDGTVHTRFPEVRSHG